MNVPEFLKNKWVLGGIAVIGVVAFVLYSRAGRPAPQAESPTAGPMASPALLYSPSGGGGAIAGGIGGGLPSLTDILGGGSAPSGGGAGGMGALLDAIAADAKNTATRNDLQALTTLDLTPGMTGSVTHSANGVSLSVNQGKRDPSTYTSGDITEFIAQQARQGVPINAASITQWQQQYGVPDSQLGAAYGMDVQGVAAWKAANPAVSAVTGPVSTPPASQPTVAVAQRPNYSDADIIGFINQKQAQGVPINASNIRRWAHEYDVAVGRIGEAFGMDAAGTAAWLAANPG